MSDRLYISIHSSTSHLTGKNRTYEAIKAAVIEAGRFSMFEACEMSNLFSRLKADREIATFKLGFPGRGPAVDLRPRNRKRAKGSSALRPFLSH